MQKRTRSLKLGTQIVNALWSCIVGSGQDILLNLIQDCVTLYSEAYIVVHILDPVQFQVSVQLY